MIYKKKCRVQNVLNANISPIETADVLVFISDAARRRCISMYFDVFSCTHTYIQLVLRICCKRTFSRFGTICSQKLQFTECVILVELVTVDSRFEQQDLFTCHSMNSQLHRICGC